jgi:hypothetical protein
MPTVARWWELVLCAYWLVSLQAPALAVPPADAPAAASAAGPGSPAMTGQHPAWTEDARWKHRHTNLRMLLQPLVCAYLLLHCLHVHPLPHHSAGLADLCAFMNIYHPTLPT